jgi:hypothetical protein
MSVQYRKILRHGKDLFEVWPKTIRKTKLIISFTSFSCFATKWLCWLDCQRALVHDSGVFPVGIIPSWFSMLIYHLGVEQWALWWPQFRYIASPHHHHHHHQGRTVTHIVVVNTVTQKYRGRLALAMFFVLRNKLTQLLRNDVSLPLNCAWRLSHKSLNVIYTLLWRQGHTSRFHLGKMAGSNNVNGTYKRGVRHEDPCGEVLCIE